MFISQLIIPPTNIELPTWYRQYFFWNTDVFIVSLSLFCFSIDFFFSSQKMWCQPYCLFYVLQLFWWCTSRSPLPASTRMATCRTTSWIPSLPVLRTPLSLCLSLPISCLGSLSWSTHSVRKSSTSAEYQQVITTHPYSSIVTTRPFPCSRKKCFFRK